MTDKTLELDREATARPDTAKGSLGAHPVGTGLGAVAGGAAGGAMAGTLAGPVGTVAGALAGAVVGGLAGHDIAESIDATAEESFWRQHYATRSYVTRGAAYDEYGPAYRYGVDAYEQNKGRSFEQAEPELMRDWDRVRGTSKLTWENAKHAARDAWQRLSNFVEGAAPGDSEKSRN